ncbi:MAG: L,D-transpeptidase family protein [Candidatus Dadabacteria bacterium]|nr:L,D-transpeptidase family protein [Candidatus Dadabacteria bacterium]
MRILRIFAVLISLSAITLNAESKTSAYLFGEDKFYVVQKGDYLYKIAKDNDVSFPFLQKANLIADPNVIVIGKKLLVSSKLIVPKKLENGILINLPEYRLYFFHNNRLKEILPLAIGLETWRTPTGAFKIINKIKDPVWYMPKEMANKLSIKREIIPAGPLNPLGDMWIGLSIPHIGIHSTNQPMSIGKPLSHGCMRLYPWHATELFEKVKVDMNGEIIYEPVKIAVENEKIYLEVHGDVYNIHKNLVYIIKEKIKAQNLEKKVDFSKIKKAAENKRGVPIDITKDNVGN